MSLTEQSELERSRLERSESPPESAPESAPEPMFESRSESESADSPGLDRVSLDLDGSCVLPQGELRYGIRGEGAPVLLIMGFMARGRSWRAQVEALSSQYQVVWFDHRGVGDSSGPAAQSMLEFTEDCVALLDHLGWESAHVLGVSMGGMIAQELALQAPKRVRSLTLIVTQPGGVLSAVPTARGFPIFLRAQLARSPQGRIDALKSLLVPDQARALIDEDELSRKLRADFTPKPPPSTRLRHIKAVLRHDVRSRLPKVAAPTLVVQALDDLLVHPKHSERIARLIPNARLVSFSDAGHGVIRQSRVPINEAIASHLAESEQTYLLSAHADA